MRPALIASGVAATVASAMIATAPAPARESRGGRGACGVELWGLKTLADRQARLVNLRPRNTTVAAINARPMPHRTPRTRTTRFARHVWRVVAQIVLVRLEDDQDIHLVLFAGDAYMIAEMPASNCLRRARDRRAIVAARRSFVRACGLPSGSFQPLGAVVRIAGVGFWDFPHGQRGHARNYAELHPVTNFKLISGCGGG
jgi:hypothetical protein